MDRPGQPFAEKGPRGRARVEHAAVRADEYDQACQRVEEGPWNHLCLVVPCLVIPVIAHRPLHGGQ